MGGGSEGRQLVVDFPLTESFSFYTKKKCWHCFIDYFPTHAAIQSSCCKRARSSVVRAWLVFAAMLGAGSCSVPLAASEFSLQRYYSVLLIPCNWKHEPVMILGSYSTPLSKRATPRTPAPFVAVATRLPDGASYCITCNNDRCKYMFLKKTGNVWNEA